MQQFDSNTPSAKEKVRRGVFSRRNFLLGSSVVAGAATLSACSKEDKESEVREAAASLGSQTVPFDGPHQAGISTPQQAWINVVGFNFKEGVDKESVQRLLRLWTDDARRMCAGENPVGSLEPELLTRAANLTITCGFGERFFSVIGREDARPSWVQDMPVFDKDELDPAWGQTDLVLQVCGDDPLGTSFATRHMTRAGVDYVQMAWMQQGFLNAKGYREEGETPRNLFGQKDGTVNPRSDEEYNEQVWIEKSDDSPEWMAGGTAFVLRRIAMNLDTWEILDRTSREESTGRTLGTGAPLGGQDEFDEADFKATDHFGLPVIDPKSHIALAAPKKDPEERMRRRAYNYDVPPLPGSDQLSNAGLIFCCFQKDPRTSFIPVQQRLNDADRLNEWITHIGSAVYAIPPGVTGTEYWGETLFS